MGMTETMTEPISTRNLDRYGSPELPWSRPRDILVSDTPEADLTFFVATVRPNGRPHSAGVGAVWVDGALYFTSGPGTLKSRNLAGNPACSVSVRLRGMDLVLEGEAHRVTDASTLERLAAVYRTSGWPASVEGDALTAPYSAPSAGPPPGTCTASRCTQPSAWPPPSPTAPPAGTSPTKTGRPTSTPLR
jgi:hypothetical protein